MHAGLAVSMANAGPDLIQARAIVQKSSTGARAHVCVCVCVCKHLHKCLFTVSRSNTKLFVNV